MRWLLAFHIIPIVCWFAGLFYLPRLYVYHAKTNDPKMQAQYKIMEHRLYWYIMTPASIFTLIFGLSLWLPHYAFYSHMMWLHVKLTLVLLLYGFHGYLGRLRRYFKNDNNKHTEKFYRILNEVPTIALIAIVILAVVQPGASHYVSI